MGSLKRVDWEEKCRFISQRMKKIQSFLPWYIFTSFSVRRSSTICKATVLCQKHGSLCKNVLTNVNFTFVMKWLHIIGKNIRLSLVVYMFMLFFPRYGSTVTLLTKVCAITVFPMEVLIGNKALVNYARADSTAWVPHRRHLTELIW